METAPGVFRPGHIDLGTAVLLDGARPAADGTLLDLGCGWGPIALTMALRSPRATVWAVDVNERALDLVRGANASRAGPLGERRRGAPPRCPADLTFDALWSNPPVRVGKDALHDLLRSLAAAPGPGRRGAPRVQRHLGSDSLQTWIQTELAMPCTRLTSSKGFRVLEVRQP